MSGNTVPRTLVIFGWWLHGAGLLVTAAIVAGAVLIVYRPLDRSIARIDRQYSATSSFLERAHDVQREHREWKRQLSDMEGRFANVMARIPAEASESNFLAQLSELAQRTGLTIQDYRPGAVSQQEEHREMEISLSARSQYAGLCEFLAELESLPRLCRITQLNVSVPKSDTPETYPIEMTLRIYFSQLQETAS